MIILVILIVILLLFYLCATVRPSIQYFHLKSENIQLSSMLDPNILQEETIPWDRLYNPSMVKFGNDMLIIARFEYKSWFKLYNTTVLQKISGCNPTNKSKMISKPFEIIHNDSSKRLLLFTLQGYEDPRIFVYKGNIYALVTIPGDNDKISVYIAKISQSLMTIEKLIKIKTPNKIEKNWNPFIPEQGLFVSNVQPHTIMKVNMETGDSEKLYSTTSKILSDRFSGKNWLRGGTRYVETDKGYLAICHFISTAFYPIRHYYHIFYMVEKDPPYRITSFSCSFRIPHTVYHGIQFISGLERVDDKLWIAYGEQDKTGHIAIVDVDYAVQLATQNSAIFYSDSNKHLS